MQSVAHPAAKQTPNQDYVFVTGNQYGFLNPEIIGDTLGTYPSFRGANFLLWPTERHYEIH
jgi:hypothetical protein